MLSKLVGGCGCDGGGTTCVCGTGQTPPAGVVMMVVVQLVFVVLASLLLRVWL